VATKPLNHARPRAGRRTLRRSRGARRVLAILAIVALTPWPSWLFLSTPEARAAAATAASVSGGSGSYTDPATGRVYVKQGGSATLNVTTTSDTKCVDVSFSNGAQKMTQTSNTAKTSWSFAINVGAGADEVVTATAGATTSFNSSGNCTGSMPASSRSSASYVVDNTGPVVTGTKTPAANAAGWNNSNVAIAWTATDVGSGVKTGPTPSADSVTSNTAGITKTSTATDNLGHTSSGSVAVKLDKMPPSIDATRTPAPNGFGWNNTDVTVGFTCSDALSGIKSCSGGGSVTVSTEGANQSVPGEAVDNADNRNAAGVTGINIDKTRPSLTGTPVGAPSGTDAQGVKWYSGDVAIAWDAKDGLSGLAGAAPANSTITGEGKDLFASQSVSDKAGNTTSADSARVNIDGTAPSTDATAPSGWTNTDQTVTLSAKDALSGLKATHYILDGGAQQTGTSVAIRGDGVHTLEYWSEDFAGNVETHKTIEVKIDGTSPTIGHTQSPLANANGWNNTDVRVSFVCDDARSGIASCTPDKVVSDEGKDQLVTGTATDNAGNTATDPATVSIDKTAPKVAASADRAANGNLAANGNGWYADDVTVSFACSDALSGIDTCPAAKTFGEGYDQSASGTATDAAGNSGAGSLGALNVDRTAPSLSGEPTTPANGAGWYAGDVTIAWTCADALSGIDGGCPADSTLTGEGSGLRAGASVSDRAGHTTSANSASIKIDRTAPSTSAEVLSALDSGWYAGPVTVTLNAVDSLSGIDGTFYSVDGGTAQVYDAAAKPSVGKGTHTFSFWSVDKAGNVEDKTAAGNSITLKVDDVKPTITGSRLPAANAFGWNNTPVDASFVCTDAESGIAGCVGDTTVSGEGKGQSVVGHAVDNAGNDASTTVDDINIDLTKPTLEGRPTTPDNAAGWYKGDVTIAWQAQDGLSGIDPASLPANSVITGQGVGLKAGPATVKDKAGNVSDPTSSQAVNVDRTPPTITGSRTPAANLLGWNNGPVTVGFSCSDALSGIAECPAPVVLDADGTGLSASGTATDRADNTAAATVGNIKIDSKAPRSDGNLVCTSKNGYCKGTSASVNITATDPAPAAGITTSGPKEIKFRVNGGLVTTAPGSTATANVTLSGSGTAIVEFWAVDNAGNAETPNKVEIKYDTIAPAITHTQPGNAAGWSNGDATVRFRAEDDSDGSGLDKAATFCGPTPAAAEGAVTADPNNAKVLYCDTTWTAETAGQVIKAQADDLAANTGFDSNTVKVDKTKPTISATATGAQGSNGWYKGPVTVAFTCSDPLGANGATGSGIATCPSAEVIGNGAGQTVAGTAEDRADNRASTTAGPFNVDTDGPKLELGGVANGGVYTLGSAPKATCTATDVGPSGLDGTCSVSVTGGLANGVGTFSFSATAKDVAGNVTTVTGSYKVIYNVPQGTAFWLQPINDTAHEVNATSSVFKAGSTVPAKFRLKDANGQAIQTNSAPVWLSPVKGSATTATVDETVYSEPADTATMFRWSATDQQYQYNWASPKNGAGNYWRIGVKLDDGTVQTVNIALR
jgi:hypothetical protein